MYKLFVFGFKDGYYRKTYFNIDHKGNLFLKKKKTNCTWMDL